MGIFCKINLFKPPNEVYQPGQSVTGIIQYTVDEPMQVDKITTSFKGSGLLVLRVLRGNREGNTYLTEENYFDIDNIVQSEKVEIPVGAYEHRFNFNIPDDIPSTTKFIKYIAGFHMKCKIKYYIRIKFERPGMFAFNKHFKKEITIISGGSPKLRRDPVMYGETSKLMSLFSSKSNVVKIKATIANSVIPVEGKIELNYEVENSSNSKIKSVETKLIEVYKFNAIRHPEISNETGVPDTDTKTPAVKCGDTQIMPVNINIPSDVRSLKDSKIVSREYFVRIEAALPIPHKNVVLNIPVQIGAIEDNTLQTRLEDGNEEIYYNDPPPSYWEAMGESKKEDDDDSDSEYSNEKSKK